VATMLESESERVPFAVPPTEENLLLRASVEQFLAEESALLDAWRLDEWLALFTKDAQYVIPALDCPDANPKRDMVYVDDDYAHLEGRVKRLMGRHQHREYPYSKTRRLMGLVRLARVDAEEVAVDCPFVVYRARDEVMAPYVGVLRYRLVRQGEGRFLIRYRRAELAHERLSDHGAISIIL